MCRTKTDHRLCLFPRPPPRSGNSDMRRCISQSRRSVLLHFELLLYPRLSRWQNCSAWPIKDYIHKKIARLNLNACLSSRRTWMLK